MDTIPVSGGYRHAIQRARRHREGKTGSIGGDKSNPRVTVSESARVPVPTELRTERLVMRPWRAEDATALHPILVANWEHLGPWIPARVATPVPVAELAQRLAGFGDDFASGREFRYGLFAPDGRDVLGEAGLYPRSATKRVPFASATCIELGYWLRADLTGRGLVTEASRALLDVAAALPHMTHVEVRCDARNAPSSAIPQRLGFALTATLLEPAGTPNEEPVQLQVWTLPLPTR